MPDDKEMKPIEIDALTEAGNIGAGHAATSLSKLLREHIMNSSTQSMIVPIEQVPEVLGGAEKVISGIYTTFEGELSGGLLMLFPEESTRTLIKLLSGQELEGYEITDFEASLLSEVGNICLCWYLSAISKMIGIDITPSVPVAAYDMTGAVIDLPLIQLGRVANHAMVIKTNFKGEVHEINGFFLMLPEPDSQRIMVQKLGVV